MRISFMIIMSTPPHLQYNNSDAAQILQRVVTHYNLTIGCNCFSFHFQMMIDEEYMQKIVENI